MVLENAIDYHHEVIESIVRRYPLPWDSFNCTVAKPIIYDFALFDNRFPDRIPFYIGKPPKFLNLTEFWGWKKYFEKNLQNKIVVRAENSTTTSLSFGGEAVEEQSIGSSPTGKATYALYNNLILDTNYNQSPDGPADAIIDVSCGIDKAFLERLKKTENTYCLLHGYVQEVEDNEYIRSKTCWISVSDREQHHHQGGEHLQ